MNNDENLKIINSVIFDNESLNLSSFNRDIINSVLSLNIIEVDDISLETLKNFRYFNKYFILLFKKEYYFINSSYIEAYYTEINPLKILDYKVLQRKDKLEKIEKFSN